jgi:hypothetical protein
VPARRFAAEFQAVQRALARQRFLAHPRLPAQHPQQRIFPQLVVIGEILVAERPRIDALRNQLADGVGNQPGLAVVLNASGQAREQVQPPVWREKWAWNSKLDWVHSVIAKAAFFLALTAAWKLSYARRGGFLLDPA